MAEIIKVFGYQSKVRAMLSYINGGIAVNANDGFPAYVIFNVWLCERYFPPTAQQTNKNSPALPKKKTNPHEKNPTKTKKLGETTRQSEMPCGS